MRAWCFWDGRRPLSVRGERHSQAELRQAIAFRHFMAAALSWMMYAGYTFYNASSMEPISMTLRIGLTLLAGTMLCGCAGSAPRAFAKASTGTSANASVDATDARVKALVERTLKHLVFLKGGTFDMGDWGGPSGLPYDSDADSKPVHKVTLDSFSIMAYEATYEDFDVFTDAVGIERINTEERYADQRGPRKAASPNWYGAKAYCQWLGQQTKLPFDLPTEAQWEYAARSRGQHLLFATNTGMIDRGKNFPAKKPWDAKNWDKSDIPQDVGSFPPNPAGLFGMSEGATEWVNDWYDPKYYEKSPEMNPQGPATGTKKVQRGSSGVPAEAANMVFMRAKDLPRTIRTKVHFDRPWEKVQIPGYSSLPGNAIRCVVNSPTRVD